MTEIENECLNVLLRVRDAWTRKYVSRDGFMEIMFAIVQAIKHLEAKGSGCATGTHVGRCHCKPAIVGPTYEWQYHRKKRMKVNS